jgi:hypothetical protein
MKINEIIKEATLTELTVDPGIAAALYKKGYREVGKGMDQLVFSEPGTKMILKIFGTNKVAKPGKLSYPQKTFVAFAEYCAANPENQFLPYFSGWETFEFKGQGYLQIRTERLFPAEGVQNVMYALEQLVEIIKSNPGITPGEVLWKVDRSRLDYLGYADDETNYAGPTGIEPVMLMMGGEQEYEMFVNTCAELALIAKKNGFYLDLHKDNFMLGSDGHIVINDPFFSGWGKREI